MLFASSSRAIIAYASLRWRWLSDGGERDAGELSGLPQADGVPAAHLGKSAPQRKRPSRYGSPQPALIGPPTRVNHHNIIVYQCRSCAQWHCVVPAHYIHSVIQCRGQIRGAGVAAHPTSDFHRVQLFECVRVCQQNSAPLAGQRRHRGGGLLGAARGAALGVVVHA